MTLFRPIALALALIASPALTPSVMAEEPGAWQVMRFNDLRNRSPLDALQVAVWPDVIREANDYVEKVLKRPLNGRNAWITALSATFRDENRTVLVSTVLSRSCDTGANHAASGIERSICPLRIVLIEKDRAETVLRDAGCYLDPPDAAGPPGNRHDGIHARFDPERRVVSLRALIGGTLAPECSRNYQLPPAR